MISKISTSMDKIANKQAFKRSKKTHEWIFFLVKLRLNSSQCAPRMVLLEDPLMWTSTGIESLSKETYSKRSQLRSWHGHSMGTESFSAVLLPHCWSSSSSIVSTRIGHPISSTVSTSSPLKTCVVKKWATTSPHSSTTKRMVQRTLEQDTSTQ